MNSQLDFNVVDADPIKHDSDNCTSAYCMDFGPCSDPVETAMVGEPIACVCACQCGNVVTIAQILVSFGICDECDYCGPRHGCEHPAHPYFRATWPHDVACTCRECLF